ncbi:discoidin domain-containing protein [Paenibacillus alba]|uniref:Discoidin domain-containing protein n=1 Tax=Paenibacillus alba TaxID=1197127 RepID=A0ABU6G7D4_9BACL|nr:discoidin domain-containing protein [Paenibacillus alba]MEC0228733.1 discoidin domain-containing protein [Paenibacillus alba]
MFNSHRIAKLAFRKTVAGLLAASMFVSLQTNFVLAAPNEQSLTKLPGIVVTASSEFNGMKAIRTIDGNVSGDAYTWTSNHNVSPHWLKIQLPSDKTISKYVLHHNGVFGNKSLNGWSFKVSVSTDNVNWTQVDQVEGNIYDVTQRTLAAPVTARYFKVEYVTPEQPLGQSAGSMEARLAEVELFSGSDAVSSLYNRNPVITLNDRTLGYTGDPVNWYINGATTPIAYKSENADYTQIPFTYMYKRHGVTEAFTEAPPSQIGQYEVKAKFAGNDTYNSAESNVALLSITKAAIQLSLESQSFTYTGRNVPMVGTVVYPIKVPYIYKYKALTPGATWRNSAPTDVGTYMVKAVFAGSDVALPAESNETTLTILSASAQSNWSELSTLLSGLTEKQTVEDNSINIKGGKYLAASMLMGNGTFGVISDARKNQQSYFLSSGDAFGSSKLVNAQLTFANGDPIVPVPSPPSQNLYTFNSSSSSPSEPPEEIYNRAVGNAFDSNERTEWLSTTQKVSQTTGVPRPLEKWVSVQGSQPFTFNKIEIKHHSLLFPDEAKYNLYNYDIQTSNNGTAWTTIKSVTGSVYSSVYSNTFDFASPITAKYLRVYTTTPVNPLYETLHFPKDMTSARITDINLFNNGTNVINPPKVNDGSFSHERDMLNAEIRSKMKYNNNLVSYQTWTADDQNAMFTNVTLDSSFTGPQKVNIQLTSPVLAGVTNTAGTDGNAIWLARHDESGFVFRGATATKVIQGNYQMGANNTIVLTLNPGETAKIATVLYTHSGLKQPEGTNTIFVTKDITTVKNIAVQKLNAVTEASINTARSFHLNWWKSYWLKSYVKLADPVIQNYYFTSLYILGSGIRQTPDWAEQPNVVGGLTGLFVTNDNAAADGNAVLNYNYEAPFYGVHSSNRTDMLQPYYADVVNGLSYWQHETAGRGYQGVQTGRQHRQLRAFYGMMDPVPVANEKNPRLSSDQKTNVLLYTRALLWDWQYNRNDEDLRRFIYPSIKQTIQFYVDFVVKKEDGKYWVEYSANNEGGSNSNASMDMGYIRTTFRDYIEMAQRLNVDADLVAKCQEILANLAPIPTSTNNPTTVSKLAGLGFSNNKEIFVGGVESYNAIQDRVYDLPWASYISSNNQPVVLEGSVHPSELIHIGSDPAMLQIAKDTFEYGDYLNPHTNGGVANGFPKSYTIAARLGYKADQLIDILHRNLSMNIYSNNFYEGENFEATGTLESVNSMLLQNELTDMEGGIFEMRLFPAWSKNYDAKFVTLRAKNAFRVSSELKNGKVLSAEIISDAGKSVTLVSPWANGIVVKDNNGNAVPATQGTTRHTNEVAYTFNTVVNGTYTITEKP